MTENALESSIYLVKRFWDEDVQKMTWRCFQNVGNDGKLFQDASRMFLVGRSPKNPPISIWPNIHLQMEQNLLQVQHHKKLPLNT